MARYGQVFKDKAVSRLLPPESASIDVVSREIGVSVSTLERWRADALASGKSEGGWTAAARLEAVLATAAMSEEQRAAWCRAKGLYRNRPPHPIYSPFADCSQMSALGLT